MVLENVAVDHELKFTFETGKELEGFLHIMNYGQKGIFVKVLPGSKKYRVIHGERLLVQPYTVADIRVLRAAEASIPASTTDVLALEFYASPDSRPILSDKNEAGLKPLSRIMIPIVISSAAPPLRSSPSESCSLSDPLGPDNTSSLHSSSASCAPQTSSASSFSSPGMGLDGLQQALQKQGEALQQRETLISKMGKLLNNHEQQRIGHLQRIERVEKELSNRIHLNTLTSKELETLRTKETELMSSLEQKVRLEERVQEVAAERDSFRQKLSSLQADLAHFQQEREEWLSLRRELFKEKRQLEAENLALKNGNAKLLQEVNSEDFRRSKLLLSAQVVHAHLEKEKATAERDALQEKVQELISALKLKEGEDSMGVK